MNPETAYLPAAENGFIESAGFDDNNVRRQFVRKVYTILSVQLIFTAGVIALFQMNETMQDYLSTDGSWLIWLSYGLFITSYFCLVCPCCNFQKRYPLNVIFLCILTVALSFMASVIAMQYKTQTVLLAAGTTALVVITVTLFTFWTKFDITQCAGIICILPLGMFFVWIFFFIPGVNVSALHAVYCGFGVMCFTVYLAFDTKLIMGGGRFELTPDDYIEAVVQLYVDIVYIFLYLLQIFGRSD